MKHLKLYEYSKCQTLKTFEYWNTNTSHGGEFNYNDTQESEYSQIVQNTISYIEDEYDDIDTTDKDSRKISFISSKIKEFQITHNNGLPLLKIVVRSGGSNYDKYDNYVITKKEELYLLEYFKSITTRLNKDRQKNYISKDIIDPVKRTASKYNI